MRTLLRSIAALGCLVASICAAPPQRIISTAPSITETLFAMGLGPRVVGVTIFCKYPAQAAQLPKIGSYLQPDVETIVALRPDLVIVQQLTNRLVSQLTALHIPHVEVESDNLTELYAGTRAIGKATGAAAEAEKLIASMQRELAQVRAAGARTRKPTVAFIVEHHPGQLEGLIVGGGKSYLSDLLEIAGGANIFAGAATPYPNISLEEILSRDPDFILELTAENGLSQQEVTALWQPRRSLRAVRDGHVYAVPAGPIVIPGPRAPQAARILLHRLHPDLSR